jgi:acetyl-CoA carboxylase biotin carboxyl carrier protein
MNDAPREDEFGLEAVRELLRLLSTSDVTELSIERGTTKLHIKRASAPSAAPFMITPSLANALPQFQQSPLPPVAAFHAEPGGATSATEGRGLSVGQVVSAPMVGTFYNAASPKDPPFVREGDEVHTGDVVGIVEAMKIMNEIETEFAGRIVRVMVNNGQPVEYGQPLFVIEPL